MGAGPLARRTVKKKIRALREEAREAAVPPPPEDEVPSWARPLSKGELAARAGAAPAKAEQNVDRDDLSKDDRGPRQKRTDAELRILAELDQDRERIRRALADPNNVHFY